MSTPEPPSGERPRPDDAHSDAPVDGAIVGGPPSRPWGRIVLGAVLVVLGVAWLLDAAGATALEWPILLAIIVAMVGAGMIVAAPQGWHGGLFAAGVGLSIALLTVAAVPVPLVGDVGDRTFRPATVAEVEDSYDHAVGQLVVELDVLDLEAEDEVELSVRLGVGDLLVVVPDGAEVVASARVGVGQATVFDRTGAGVGVRVEEVASDVDAAGVLVIDAQVGIGQVVVTQ